MSAVATSAFTPEKAWIAHPSLARAPEMTWGDGSEPRSVVIVAPHPDDETLALGGTLNLMARAGWSVKVITVTDGESSHPRSVTLAPAALATLRVAEQRAALAHLGIPQTAIVRMAEDDGGVSEHRLASRLVAHLEGADLCLAPWRADGHPDHEAAGRAAARASRLKRVRFAEYPVWAWHWQAPWANRFPWGGVRRIQLDDEARRAKSDAVSAYRSQISPLSDLPGDEAIVSAEALAHFRRPFETVFVGAGP